MKRVGAKIFNGQCYSLLDMSLPVAPSSQWFERALHRGGWRSALLCPWHGDSVNAAGKRKKQKTQGK